MPLIKEYARLLQDIEVCLQNFKNDYIHPPMMQKFRVVYLQWTYQLNTISCRYLFFLISRLINWKYMSQQDTPTNVMYTFTILCHS